MVAVTVPALDILRRPRSDFKRAAATADQQDFHDAHFSVPPENYRAKFFSDICRRSLKLIKAPVISIIGLAVGDEGKGRCVPDVIALCRKLMRVADPVWMVLKVNGGANSGHSVDGLSLNLITSGVADKTVKYLALGRGVVADPLKLHWELRYLEAKGHDDVQKRLRIDDRTMVANLGHRMMELAENKWRDRMSLSQRGGTGRGIMHAYMEEISHSQIFYQDFKDGSAEGKARFAGRFEFQLNKAIEMCRDYYKVTDVEFLMLLKELSNAEYSPKHPNMVALASKLIHPSELEFGRFYGHEKVFSFDVQKMVDEYWEHGRAVVDQVCDVGALAREVVRNKRKIIAEHGQAYQLDKRHAVSVKDATSSHTGPAEIPQTLNLPISEFDIHIVGVTKGYDTCVGAHHSPTLLELDDPLLELLSPQEKGVSTGRQRDVGWYDAVKNGTAVSRAGSHEIAINKIDQLTLRSEKTESGPVSWKGPLKVCVGYRGVDGKLIFTMPPNREEYEKITPVYVEIPGWTQDISGVQKFDDLPDEAKFYLATLYASTVNVALHNGTLRENIPALGFVGRGPLTGQLVEDVSHWMDMLSIGNHALRAVLDSKDILTIALENSEGLRRYDLHSEEIGENHLY